MNFLLKAGKSKVLDCFCQLFVTTFNLTAKKSRVIVSSYAFIFYNLWGNRAETP